jgi:hypothetical protein
MLKVRKFDYNGFCGKLHKEYTDYTAKFEEWTNDPGIAVFSCSDGENRLIPTFAIEGWKSEDYPKQPKTGVLFGAACKS